MTEPSTLPEASDAVSRYAWGEAFQLFAAADAVAPLGPDELDQMAECAWWIGKMRHCMALRERAYETHRKQGNPSRAAHVAIDLAQHYGDLGERGTATGWLQNAARLLEGQPENAEHGWLSFARSIAARDIGDLGAVVECAKKAEDLGARHGDKDLYALGHAFHGIGLVYSDDPDRGLRMVEEATQGAVAGDLGARATGMIYCMMIAVNAQVADWQAAGRWTEAATRWCNRQAINGFPGVCRVHRAEILRLRGFLAEAEDEALTATTELGSFNLTFSALAFRELGEVRLKLGELDAAEDAFRQAEEMGVTPQPGLARALVQRGRPGAAATGLRRMLGSQGLGALERAKLLPTQLEVALMLDDLPTARTAAAELAEIASHHGTPALRAVADAGEAAVLLAQDDLADAERAARNAHRLFTEIDLTYEAARVSSLLGRIYESGGDLDRARAQHEAALATYDRIGAVVDAADERSILTKPDLA
ncbi:tetratricopeptide repeat protein [Pedococcus sp. P5_B7]